jgi:hypothetical protein
MVLERVTIGFLEENKMDIMKLVKVLGYTQSPNDNEALSACRMANGILAAANLSWEQFVSQKTIVIQEIVQKNVIQKELNPETQKKLKICLENIRSRSGLEFLGSLNKQFQERGRLSERQLEALDKFYANV